MASRRVNISLSEEVFAKIEAARVDVSRSRFILRALESALGGAEESERPLDRSASASSRASEPVPGWVGWCSRHKQNVRSDRDGNCILCAVDYGPFKLGPPRDPTAIEGVDRAAAFRAASQRKKS